MIFASIYVYKSIHKGEMGKTVFSPVKVSNGVKKGGILSLILFTVYIDR